MRWLAVAVVAACVSCGSGSAGEGGSAGRTATPSTATATSTPPASGVTTVKAGDGPVGLTVDPTGAVWVADSGSAQVSRIRGGHRDLDVPGIDVPLRLRADAGGVWATAFGTGELVRIDTAGRVRGRVPVGKGAEGVAVGFGSVWVVAQDAGRLVRVDPERRTVLGRVDIGLGARLVTTGLGAVWVSQFAEGRVLRVDPATRTVTRSDQLCQGPQGLVTTHGAVWVTCTKDDVLLRLDPRTLAATARIPMPQAPDGIAVGPGGTVYVVSQAGPTLVTVDAAGASVRSRRVLAEQPQLYDQANLDVAVAPDGAWVSSFAESLLRRVDVSAS